MSLERYGASAGDKVVGWLHAFTEQNPQTLDQGRDGYTLDCSEVSEGVVRLRRESDVQVPDPVHGDYAYPTVDDWGPSATLRLLHRESGTRPFGRAPNSYPADILSLRTLGGELEEDDVRPTGDKALAAFERYERKRNLSETTIVTRSNRLKALQRAIAPKDLLDVTTSDIDRWLDKLNKPRGLAAQSRYVYIAHLAAFYGWAQKKRHVKDDPTDNLVRPKLPKRVPRPWDPAEVAGAIMLADDRMKCFLLLAWFAGARVMEMAALQVEDIHDNSILLHGKGNKERVVPLHPEVWRALKSYGLPRAGHIFRRKDGWPLKPHSISHYISHYLRSVGVDATAHQGRHRFGTDMYELSKGDLLMVASLMGHKSPETTAGYAAWAETRASGIVAQLSFRQPVPSH